MNRCTLSFRWAGTPVHVDPGFWLIALFFGWGSETLWQLAVWVGCVLLSVMMHELGHAAVGRAFGGKPEIFLYVLGGITRATPSIDGNFRWRSVLIFMAGPVASALVGLLVLAARSLWPPLPNTVHHHIVSALVSINFVWAVVNVMPLLPLDGGQALRLVFSTPNAETGLRRACWVSSVVGLILVVILLGLKYPWVAVLFAVLTISAVQQLVELRRLLSDRQQGLTAKLEDAHVAMDVGDVDRALEQASTVIELAKAREVRFAAIHVMALSYLQRGETKAALAALMRMPMHAVDPFVRGASLLADGRAVAAVPHLARAVRVGNPKAPEMLAQALEASGYPERAEQVRKRADELHEGSAHEQS